MTAAVNEGPFHPPLRLWPGVVAAVILLVARFGLPLVSPGAGGAAILGGMAGSLLVIVWWLFLSRAAWRERLGAIALMAAGLAATSRVVHPSIANGMMGFMLYVQAIPVLCLALVAAAAFASRSSTRSRRVSITAGILLACGLFTLLRTDGITGDAASQLRWRWTATAEERLLAKGSDDPPAPAAPPAQPAPSSTAPEAVAVPAASPAAPAAAPAATAGSVIDKPKPAVADPGAAVSEAEWPGFRGRARDGVVRGVRLDTDWSTHPPQELWRRPIGPGWSSFAVRGDRIFTQEQRGDDEVVSAYSLKTGEPVWRHRDGVRFWESNAGAGPRATPTLANGRVFTLGGTGLLNALDERTGHVIWSRNATTDTNRAIPDWGIAGSPLVVGDVVIVATAGVLAAYDAASGAPKWVGKTRGFGYSSPHLATIGGVPHVVLVNGPGVIGVSPATGDVLWEHSWAGDSIVQPVLMTGGDLLLGSGSGLTNHSGTLRLTVAHEGTNWTVKEQWTSNGLKPYFNDFVVHDGHAYGFDGSILACISLADGARKWKGGRYGHGQMLLLPEQDLLLVLSEEGELALVKAAGDKFTELSRVKAIEGKTWNHPVLVGDVLLVRNGEEMAAFKLVRANSR